MRHRRGLVVVLLAVALGGSLGDPRTRGRLLLAVSRMAGSLADACRSLQISAGARYVDLTYPPQTAPDSPAGE